MMEFAAIQHLKQRKRADLIVLPFWQGKQKAEAATKDHALKSLYSIPIETQDFKGKESELLIIYDQKLPEKRMALLGLGEPSKITPEKLRRAYAVLAKACLQKKFKEINLQIPSIPSLGEEGLVRGIAEGLLLANYAYTLLKHDTNKENPVVLLQKATWISEDKKLLSLAEKYRSISQSVYLARDLVNGNADDVTPQYLAQIAKDFAKKLSHVKATVLGKKELEKEKMGLLLAVNRGSLHDPVMIILQYRGNPKSKDHTVIVGKGITYDTGGLNLKMSGMDTMKCDMAGAAIALCTIQAASSLGLPINVTAVVPATENCIGPKSYKQGDVYQGYSGKTVEIMNTDAEGRLILADALAYSVKNLKPSRIIDFATLTGAIEIALGAETSGLMSNNDVLADLLIRAGSDTYERVWRMPLYEEYKDQLKSDVADIKSTGGRPASSITAAMFLQEFVGQTPWAHLDIAGTAFLADGRRYHPKHGTGIGVRLMIDFLEHL